MPDAAEIALRDGTLVGVARRAALLTAAERRWDREIVGRSRQKSLAVFLGFQIVLNCFITA